MPARKKPVPRATSRAKRPLPQTKIEIGPKGILRWGLTVDGRLVSTDLNKKYLVDTGRHLLHSIAASGGRAELMLKNRKGQIEPGGQGRDSSGFDPRSRG